MVLIIHICKPTYENISLNMWLIKKFMQKNFKNKNLQQSCHFKFLKIKKIYIRKVSMHFTNKFFI
jgi:hypothetical protein